MTQKEDKKFTPPWWLHNRHVQSCLSALFRPISKAALTWEQLELPDGDFIDLCWAGKENAPIVILLYGLEGSVNSHYIQFMLDALIDAGFQAVVMHFRTCSGRLNRLARSYHAGETGDLKYLIQVLNKRYPDASISAIGFSLGGNVLLHYLSEHADSPLNAAIAVSVPFELNRCADYLAPFYHWALLRSMKRKTVEKIIRGYDMPVTRREVKTICDFRSFDELITAPLHGFSNADDYYEQVSVRTRLSAIVHPALIIHALDDPLVPVDSIPTANQLPDNITFELYSKGGHVGFIQQFRLWEAEYWLKERILQFLRISC